MATKTRERFEERIREITNRSNGRNMASRICELNSYLRGWMGYFRALGIPEDWARKTSGSRKAYWRLANTPQVNKALGLAYWRNQGLLSLMNLYAQNS